MEVEEGPLLEAESYVLLLGVPDPQAWPLPDSGHDAQAGGTSRISPRILLVTMVVSGWDPSLPGAMNKATQSRQPGGEDTRLRLHLAAQPSAVYTLSCAHCIHLNLQPHSFRHMC